MTWQEFLNENIDWKYTGQEQTDIECPRCGRNVYLDKSIVLTSYPEKYLYWCSCGWHDCAPSKWMRRNNDTTRT